MNCCTVGHQLLLVVQIISQLRTATSRVLQWIRRNTRFRRLQHSKIDKEDFLIGHIDWCIAVDRAVQKVCILSYSKRSCGSSAFLIDHSCSNQLSSPSLKKPSAEISRAGWSKGYAERHSNPDIVLSSCDSICLKFRILFLRSSTRLGT